MKPPVAPHQLLPFHLPASLAWLLAAVLVACWVALHVAKRGRAGWLRALLFATRVVVGFGALVAVMDAVQRVLVFATNWPLWPLAAGGAVVVEVVLLLYALERGIVARPTGMALAALRVALALLVVAMLAQPVRSVEFRRSLQRYVAVLLDTSASMRVPDKQLTAAERVRVAEAAWGGAPRRPYRFEAIADELAGAREKLAAQIDWLTSLREADANARLRQLERRRKHTQRELDALVEALDKQASAIGEPLRGSLKLDARVRAALTAAGRAVSREAAERLERARERLDRAGLPGLARDPSPLLELLRQASAALAALGPGLRAAGEAVDEAFYQSLPANRRRDIDGVAARTRLELARDVLSQRPATGDAAAPAAPTAPTTRPGLLQRLARTYGVRLYTFAGKPVEQDLATWGTAAAAPSKAAPPAKAAAGTATPGTATHGTAAERTAAGATDVEGTDLAAALEKVATEMPAERLAGLVVLSDGRHNAARSVEPLARRIGLQQSPICSVVFGAGAKPTTDAAIVSLAAPDTVYARDKLYLDAELKLDGLAGKSVLVTLFDGDEPVDFDEVTVGSETFRTRVQLADEPNQTGLHAYRVKVHALDGEVLTTNNEHPLSVSVSDDQTRLLVLEGRPRWEFRYLKNLFASRDRTVKLQYVLLEPDVIPGQAPRPKVAASAARAKEEPEATAPPASEAEWMKFDVIVLGDIEPSALRRDDLASIRKFVAERGGTLVVIAGPRHMPHAYADTPLADILPVTFEPLGAADAYLTSPDKQYRLALTAEGRHSVVTRLQVDPEENLAAWESLPDIRWRHPLTRAKPGATVLAYALPPAPPDFLTPTRPHEVPDEETLAQRRAFERERALVTEHHAALGRVLFLSFDRTWRLRYRVGDTLHHKLWGQVLRWATADKLPAGTTFVKVGTDQPRYAPHSPVRARAKLVRPDYSPIRSDRVTASVYAGSRLVLRKKMGYVANSLGVYTADLGVLPGGTYRLEVDAPEARDLLAAEGAERVATQFFVESAIPVEQVELTADRGLLEGLASLTGGKVVEPHRAADVVAALGPGRLSHRERRQWALWDSWPLLALIVLLAGIEWFLRKRARLP